MYVPVFCTINGLGELRKEFYFEKLDKLLYITAILVSAGPMDPKKLKPGMTRSMKDVICFCSERFIHTDFSEDKEVQSIF